MLAPGSGEYLSTYTVSMWCSGIHDTRNRYSGPRIPLKRCAPRFLGSLPKRKGGKGSSRVSFANKEGEIQVVWVIPGQLRDSRSSKILVYTRGIDIGWANKVFNVFLSGFVIRIPLSISGHR